MWCVRAASRELSLRVRRWEAEDRVRFVAWLSVRVDCSWFRVVAGLEG